MGQDPGRTECTTFEDYIISLFKARKTNSEEFKTMLGIYGRERLAEIWKKYKEAGEEEKKFILR